jgi:hypothetical protein
MLAVRTGPWPLRTFFYEHRSTSTSIKAGRPPSRAGPLIPRCRPRPVLFHIPADPLITQHARSN